jgi:hypothetical protein
VRGNYTGKRSVSTEIGLELGRCEILPKISATRSMDKPSVEDIVKRNIDRNPQKLRQIGLNYDIAHTKGGFDEGKAESKEKEEKEEPKVGEKGEGNRKGVGVDKFAESATKLAKEIPSEESPSPWNAVAVIGLRVYSKDPQLTVNLVKQNDSEEATLLDVDGISGAGATM